MANALRTLRASTKWLARSQGVLPSHSSRLLPNLARRNLGYSATWRESGDAQEEDPLKPPDPSTYLKGFDEVKQTSYYKGAIFQACHLQPGVKILDIGCGTATHIPLYASAVGPTGSVTGIDISPRVIEKVNELYASDNVGVQVANVYDLPFEAGWLSEQNPLQAQ